MDTYYAMPWKSFVDLFREAEFEFLIHERFSSNMWNTQVFPEHLIAWHKKMRLLLNAASFLSPHPEDGSMIETLNGLDLWGVLGNTQQCIHSLWGASIPNLANNSVEFRFSQPERVFERINILKDSLRNWEGCHHVPYLEAYDVAGMTEEIMRQEWQRFLTRFPSVKKGLGII